MNIILVTGILLIIASLALQRNKKLPPYWGFILVFLIMGFQEGVLGDFMNYKESYEAAARGIAYSGTAEEDSVWLFLNSILSKIIPFWLFVALMSGFQCWVLFIVGRKYGSKEYGWLGPILFFFTFYMMLIQMKAMRQGLATEIVVLSYYMTTQKKGFWKSIVLLLIAYFVHHSTIAAVPLVALQLFVANKKELDKDNKTNSTVVGSSFPIVMVGLYLFVYYLKALFLGDWLMGLSLFIGDDFRFVGYLDKEQRFVGEEISMLIVLYDAIMVFLCSWFMQRTTRRYKILAIASIVGCFLDMLLFGMGSLPRIAMFYIVYNIYTYPKLTELVSQKYGKLASLVLIVFLVGYALKTSLPWILEADEGRFGTYHFVFW